MSDAVEFSPRQRETEQVTVNVLWMTTGLSCEGDSVAMTAATNPSLEDMHRGTIPGMPKCRAATTLFLAYECGRRVRAGVVRRRGRQARSVRARDRGLDRRTRKSTATATGRGSALNPTDGPADHDQRVGRPACAEGGRRSFCAFGTCATYGGIPAMKNNPTGAMGLRDYLGCYVEDRGRHPDREHPRLPGAARQHDRDADATWSSQLVGIAPGARARRPGPADVALRATPSREGCSRAGFTEQGSFAVDLRRRPALPGEARLQGPGRQVQRPSPRLGQRRRRLPECRRDLHGVHDARVPRQVHAVHGPRPMGQHGGQLPAVHLRPPVPVPAQAQRAQDVRTSSPMAPARAGADQRLRQALVERARMRIRIVDAFTDRVFAGNPAGVCVLDGDWPDEAWMQQLAGSCTCR